MSKNEEFSFRIQEDFKSNRIDLKKAVQLLGIRPETVSRRLSRLRKKGVSGLVHGNQGRVPANKTSDAIKLGSSPLVVGQESQIILSR